ncbi:hypothetical protein [Spirosoma spitsbergense]|uniref:hypothetical protein n=1 Tax=Spirosoma spitsbergense TaxID=431554 RepID=UPI0003816E61|nr:hypothetical protein [Spirosoma spitsbergense]
MARRTSDLSTVLVAKLLLITPDLLHRVMAQVIEANSAFIENLNRAQLFDGKRADGSDITPDYTEYTVAVKQSKGQRSDRVTVRDTGSFYESIFTEVFTEAFDLKADDPKTGELLGKYGNLLGLMPESKEKLSNHIKPQFVAVLKQEIGL